jgi:hypothetical protein
MRKISELLRLRVEHCNFGGAPVFFNINGRDVDVLPDHLLVEKSKNRRPRLKRERRASSASAGPSVAGASGASSKSFTSRITSW